MIPRADLDRALDLYRSQHLDLEGLCALMAAYGRRPTHRAVPNGDTVSELARDLGLLLTPALPEFDEDPGQATVIEQISEPVLPPPPPSRSGGPPSRSGGPPSRSGGPPPLPGAPDPLRQSGALRAVDQLSPLQRFSRTRGIEAKVRLEHEPGAPDLKAKGDARYGLGRKLGAGGVGQVFWSVDRDMRRTVALKRLHDPEDNLQVQAFIEEAIITGGLTHPNIVPIYELGYSEALGGPYYVMKRIDGASLYNILRELRAGDRAATEKNGLFRLLDIFVDICHAIAYSHDHKVVHSDLKPANVVVGRYGEVTVVDWGLARVLGDRGKGQARTQMWSGTPAYMSPEQVRGDITDLGAQADIWALGAILYEMLTLSVPFVGENNDDTLVKLMADPVQTPSERAPHRHIPAALEDICMRALQKDRRQRYASVHDILRDVAGYVAGESERRQRAEQLQGSRDRAARALSRLSRAEQQVDALQQQLLSLGGQVPYELGQALNDARDDLVFGYGDACNALCVGLEVDPLHPPLIALTADLYWRCFQRLYPARVSASEAVRVRGMEILSRLSERALGEIVRAGRAAGLTPDANVSDDPWLATVLGFCRGEALLNQGVPDAIAQTVERVAFLKAVPIFEHIASHELLSIADACDQVDLESGQSIFNQGDAGDALFVVIRGAVQIVHDGAVLTTLGPRACFGEIAVLDASTRTAGALCRSRVSCLRLTAARFRQIVASQGEIGLSVMQVLTRRLRIATDREAKLRRG